MQDNLISTHFPRHACPPTKTGLDWIGLMLLVFVLGMRHGLDADHLVAIDCLTRFNAGTNPRLARRCGALFSLGHGIVVMLVAVTVALFAQHFTLPPWLADLGVWLSITFLLTLGMLVLLGFVLAMSLAKIKAADANY